MIQKILFSKKFKSTKRNFFVNIEDAVPALLNNASDFFTLIK